MSTNEDAHGVPPARVRLGHVPRLSIGFLLFWTAVTSVVILLITYSTNRADLSIVDVLLLALPPAIIGWLLAGTLLIARHAVRRTLWQLEPGEWLVLAGTVVAVVFIGEWLVDNFIIGLQNDSLSGLHGGGLLVHDVTSWLRWTRYLSLGATTIVYVVAAVAQRRRSWWCATLSLIAAQFLWSFLLTEYDERIRLTTGDLLLLVGFILLAMLTLGLLVASIISDRRLREPRHWLHWSGVTLTALSIVFEAAVKSVHLVASLLR